MMMVAEEKFLLIECEWKIGGCGGGRRGGAAAAATAAVEELDY